MSTPTKNQVKTQAQIAHDALAATANQLFINAADAQIQGAIAQGLFFVNCQTVDDKVDPQAIFNYYSNLGYIVTMPDVPTNIQLGPAQLFGEFWVNFWTNNLIPANVKYPLRFLISWNP